MKVYIIDYWDSPDVTIKGVFSTRELAKKAIEESNAVSKNSFGVCEFEVDEYLEDGISTPFKYES